MRSLRKRAYCYRVVKNSCIWMLTAYQADTTSVVQQNLCNLICLNTARHTLFAAFLAKLSEFQSNSVKNDTIKFTVSHSTVNEDDHNGGILDLAILE